MDLAKEVSCRQTYPAGRRPAGPGRGLRPLAPKPRHHVVAVDFGAKRNILRCLAAARLPTSPWCRPTCDGGGRSWPSGPTASSCPTARAIRRRPATTPCRAGLLEKGAHGMPESRTLAAGRKMLRHLPGPPDHQPEPRPWRWGRRRPRRCSGSSDKEWPSAAGESTTR